MDRNDALLGDWRERALALEREIGRAVIAQQGVIRLATTAVFARGHVLLQGDVGVARRPCCAHWRRCSEATTRASKARSI